MTWDFAVSLDRVIDGDTVSLAVDVGFYLTTVQRFRLLGVDTPERSEPGWAECTAATRAWFAQHAATGLRAVTSKTDHFGRWLADIRCADGHLLSDDLNALMNQHGWTSPAVR